MADRFAGGDLSGRMRETDLAEIGALQRSFNVMAGSLEKSRDELASLLAEQAALRRVATLVASGAVPVDVFAVTATDVCRLRATNATALCRYEPDATATVVALETDVDIGIGVGTQLALEGASAVEAVFRTGQASRQEATKAPPVRSPILLAKGVCALRSAPRSWSKGASGEWWSRLRAAGYSLPTPSAAWSTSPSSWPR
jgi:nitrogen fixation/metabolism regulation signal transduction histidine kinase